MPGIRLRGLVRLGAAVVAVVALWWLLDGWIGDGSSIAITGLGDRPIELLEPRWLLLIATVPAFYLLRVVSLTDLAVIQQLVQATLRSLVIAALAIALARPTRITEERRVATVVLVDVSDSVSDAQLDAARRYVDALAAAAGDGNLQLVTFAEQPRVVRDAQIARHAGAGAGTDTQAAMQLAYGLFPDGYLPRLLIVSDGNQTAGDVAVEAYRARELGVRISWRTFAGEPVREVRVVGLTVPDDLRVGQPYEVTAEVWSTEPQDIVLALQQDEFPNALEPSKQVRLHEGRNFVKLRSQAQHAGATSYRLQLRRFEHDTEPANNVAVMTAPVTGRPHVLYVEGSALRVPGSAGYFQRALEHEHIDVEVRGPNGLPSTAAALEPFDLVVVSDLPAHLVGLSQIAALDRYVATLGGGLIMAGGEDSFGAGGYQGTRIEQMMPVRFDGKRDHDHPDVAVVLAIDRSSSMAGPKLEAAKTAARATAEALKPTDSIAVIAFDSGAQVFIPAQRAGNRAAISAEIARLATGGGTNIRAALAASFDVLKPINARIKHVILLTDGEAPVQDIPDLVADMAAARITVSCVGVQDADRRLLETIIEAGGGRLIMVDDLDALPRLVVQETHQAARSQLVEDLVHVRIAKPVEAIEGTGVANAPPLRGYVTTQARPLAETILISDLGEPILARWRYGGGMSVAWTSDLKNRWSIDWLRWAGYPKFWAQVVRSAMRRKAYDSYDLVARVADGRAVVTVDAIDSSDRFVNELDTRLEVIDPATNQVTQSLAMDQTAAGRYTAGFPIRRYGSYLLKAVHQRAGKTVAESIGSVALSYPLEYLRTTPNLEPLQHAARVSGGLDQAEPARMFDPGTETVRRPRELWPYVLIGAVALFLIDLYAKRIRLLGYRILRP